MCVTFPRSCSTCLYLWCVRLWACLCEGLCEVCRCCTRCCCCCWAIDVLRGYFFIVQRKRGLESSRLCSGGHRRAHRHAHPEAMSVAVTRGMHTWKCGCSCCIVRVPKRLYRGREGRDDTYDPGTQQQAGRPAAQ